MAERGTIVYVHGASDRAAQVADHVARMERQLASAGMEFDVMPARWGDLAGADLTGIDDALPPADVPSARAAPAAPPLAELAAMAGAQPLALMDAPASPDATSPRRQSDELLDICRTQVGAPGEVVRMPDGTEMPMAVACRRAAVEVAESPEYSVARGAPVPDQLLVDAVGRAVASTVGATAAAPFEVARTVEVRIAEAVLGAALATIFVGYLGIDVGPDLKRWATDVLIPHRSRLIREAGLGPADIVLYQRSGERIRQVVSEAIAEAVGRGGPTIALGNSLGGIVLVDLLAAPGAPRPDLLVTVGSQAPLLATFGALAPLDRGPAGKPFQPWLNIYDRRDLLGFVASGVWPGEAGITDHEVDMGQGFPDAHGAAYFDSPEVFTAIRNHPALSAAGAGLSVARFQIPTAGLSGAARFVLGAGPANSTVEINGGFRASVGRLGVETPLSNLAGWKIDSPAHNGASLLGVVRGLLAGVAALSSASGPGVLVSLQRPVRWFLFDIRAAEIATDQPERVSSALSQRNVPPL